MLRNAAFGIILMEIAGAITYIIDGIMTSRFLGDFALAASGIASDYLLWSITSVAVDELMKRGKTPGILKSANFPGGNDYNLNELQPHYQKYGW